MRPSRGTEIDFAVTRSTRERAWSVERTEPMALPPSCGSAAGTHAKGEATLRETLEAPQRSHTLFVPRVVVPPYDKLRGEKGELMASPNSFFYGSFSLLFSFFLNNHGTSSLCFTLFLLCEIS